MMELINISEQIIIFKLKGTQNNIKFIIMLHTETLIMVTSGIMPLLKMLNI